MTRYAEGTTEGDLVGWLPWLFLVESAALAAGAEDDSKVLLCVGDPWLALDLAELRELKGLIKGMAGLFKGRGAVLAIHRAAIDDPDRSVPCPECGAKAGVWTCGCWADQDAVLVCAVCQTHDHHPAAVRWPCPTARALGVKA